MISKPWPKFLSELKNHFAKKFRKNKKISQ
jgi:hypothetical protein